MFGAQRLTMADEVMATNDEATESKLYVHRVPFFFFFFFFLRRWLSPGYNPRVKMAAIGSKFMCVVCSGR